jgi:hypothetical protein
VAARLEEIAREPLITAELARRAGYALVPVEPITHGQIAEDFAKLGKEVGEAFCAFASAMVDGHVTEDKRSQIGRELQDVEHAARRAFAALQGLAR